MLQIVLCCAPTIACAGGGMLVNWRKIFGSYPNCKGWNGEIVDFFSASGYAGICTGFAGTTAIVTAQ
jgi:hypothetical protein